MGAGIRDLSGISAPMPTFSCTECGASFDLPQATLDRFPGWTPRFCRKHSPKKRTARSSGRRSRSAEPEERLTPAQVLERYTGGPQDGVFTDGSSVPNPGPGGWGVVWVRDGEILAEKHGHDPDTTNNRMELVALIEAFEMLPADAAEVVHTDSKLCRDTVESWAPGWEAKGWTRKSGPIKNLDLVKRLLAVRRAHPGCEVRWIAAHSGNRWNEYADALSALWRDD